MGNCQAIDAAALVIQHPDGRIERLYWSITVSEVMKTNPGHYVSLIIPLPPEAEDHKNQEPRKTVRYTRVKLLRPTDTLALGHAYRLVTSQEVMKVLRANKYAKKKRQQQQQLESAEKKQSAGYDTGKKSDAEKAYQGMKKHERHSTQIASVNSTSTAMRSKSWRPSLHSISESPSSTNMAMNGPQKAC